MGPRSLLYAGFLLVCVVRTWAEPHPIMEECERIDACRCRTPSGVIDLSPLDSKDILEPAFKDIPSVTPNDTDKFSWNPCTPFCEVHCEGAAVCQIWSVSLSDYYNIGDHSTSGFQMNYTYENHNITGLVATYSHTQLKNTRTSVIRLICNESAEEAVFVPYGETRPQSMHYYFELISNSSCPSNVTVPTPGPPPTMPSCPEPWTTTTTTTTTTTATTTSTTTTATTVPTTPRPPWYNMDWKLWLAFSCLGVVVLVLLYFVIRLMINLGRGKRGIAVVPHYRCFQKCCCCQKFTRDREGHQRLVRGITDDST